MASHTEIRASLSSIGDSAPSSDLSESIGSDCYQRNIDWPQTSAHMSDLHKDNSNFNVDLQTPSDSTNGILSDAERAQIESFFNSLGTEVYVCPALANLYEASEKNVWRLKFTGVPVILYDKGLARSRGVQRVTYILAERGTCFALWQDRIDNLSDYRITGPAFHTMCLSTDHNKIIGFSFDSSEAACDIWSCIERLISDPENISLSVPGRKRRKQTKKPKPLPLPPKSQISQPCQFAHVTCVTIADFQRYFSLQTLFGRNENDREH